MNGSTSLYVGMGLGIGAGVLAWWILGMVQGQAERRLAAAKLAAGITV